MTEKKSETKVQTSQISLHQVVNSFIHQYYTTLSKAPQDLHKFYHDSSSYSHNSSEIVRRVSEIEAKIATLAFQNSKVRILVLDWQESLNGSLLISVQGLMTAAKEQEAKKFSQTFILAAQQVGYFLMNDIFRYPDEIQKENQLNVKFDATTPVKPKQQETVKPSKEEKVTPTAPPSKENVQNTTTTTAVVEKQEKKTKPTKTQETKKETVKKEETAVAPVVKKEETPVVPVVKKEEKKEEKPKSFTYASVVGEVPAKSTLEPSQDEKKKKEKPKKQETKPATTTTTNGGKQEKPTKTQETKSNGQVNKKQVNQENGEKPEEKKKNHFLHAVYISKVPEALTDDDLHKKFKKYGKILDVSNKAKEKQFAFVYFETAEAVEAAEKDNGKIIIRETTVQVEKRKDRPKTFFKKNFNKKKKDDVQKKE